MLCILLVLVLTCSQESVCGITNLYLTCASNDGDECYWDTVDTLTDPNDPKAFLGGTDGEYMHIYEDC